jgi:hypothetical protein
LAGRGLIHAATKGLTGFRQVYLAPRIYAVLYSKVSDFELSAFYERRSELSVSVAAHLLPLCTLSLATALLQAAVFAKERLA